jgi:hypothetical protein
MVARAVEAWRHETGTAVALVLTGGREQVGGWPELGR